MFDQENVRFNASYSLKIKIKIITIKLSIDLIDFAYSNFLQRLLEDDAIFLKVLVKKKAVFLFTYFLTISQINKNCSFEISDSSVFFFFFPFVGDLFLDIAL